MLDTIIAFAIEWYFSIGLAAALCIALRENDGSEQDRTLQAALCAAVFVVWPALIPLLGLLLLVGAFLWIIGLLNRATVAPRGEGEA